MTEKPKLYLAIKLQNSYNIAEVIAEKCNRMLAQGFVLKDTVSLPKMEGNTELVLIFEHY